MIAVEEICPGRFQPREAMDEAALAQLAASIRSSGLIQPVAVRVVDRDGGGGGGGGDGGGLGRSAASGAARYELIAGERRWRAAQVAGLARIPAVVLDVSDREAAEIGLIENVQREQLNAVERARALVRLNSEFNITHNELAERIGMDRSTVTNLIRVMQLEPEIIALLREGGLTPGHCKALLSFPGGPDRVTLAQYAADQGWSVRKIELAEQAMRGDAKAMDKIAGARGEDARTLEEHRRILAGLEKQLSEQLGTRVRLRTNRSRSRGRLVIEFYDVEHFSGLLERFGVEVEG